MAITKERAERIAKAHSCENCGEYTYKRLVVKPAAGRLHDEMAVAWQVQKVCGVCGLSQEMGIDEDGDVVYVS